MASKFGGIPIEDEKPKAGGSKFGGVPVEEPPAPAPTGPQPEEKRGFWGSFIGRPADFVEGARGIWNTVRHPLDSIAAAGGQTEGLFRGAGREFSRGNITGGIRRGLSGVVNLVAPGMGGASEEAAEKFDRGDIRGGLGSTLALGTATAAGVKTPALVRGAQAAPRAIRGLVTVDPRIGINRGLRPIPSDPGFPRRIPDTLAAIKEANPGFKPDIEGGQLNLIPAVQRTIEGNQAALEPWMRRAQGVRISGDPIIRATREATARMLPSEAESATGLVQRAARDYGGEFTPEELRSRLGLLNERMDPFYAKAPGKQSAALADIPEAVLKAQRDAVAEALYRGLDPEGAGAGPRTIQARTGDLIDIRNAAYRRSNAILAEQPLTPIGRLIDPIKGFIRDLAPIPSSGTGIAFAEGSTGRSLPFIRRSFNAVRDPARPLPQPGEPFYPVGDTQRLLTAGDRITPPPADTSGIVPGRPPMMNPSGAPKLLAAPKTIITPPPEHSGITVTPAEVLDSHAGTSPYGHPRKIYGGRGLVQQK